MGPTRCRRSRRSTFVVAGMAVGLRFYGCRQPRGTSGNAPAVLSTAASAPAPAAAELPAVAQFHKVVEPILRERCYDCHGDGSHKGGLAFDELTATEIAHDPQLWLKVLRNTRSHIM